MYERLGRPIVDNVRAGYTGAILAYGQSGAGKTFTMVQTPCTRARRAHTHTRAQVGDESDGNRGLLPRLVEDMVEGQT